MVLKPLARLTDARLRAGFVCLPYLQELIPAEFATHSTTTGKGTSEGQLDRPSLADRHLFAVRNFPPDACRLRGVIARVMY